MGHSVVPSVILTESFAAGGKISANVNEPYHGAALRSMKTLEKIGGQPIADFWQKHAEQEVEFIRRELKRLNPAFDGELKFQHDRGIVTEFKFLADEVADMSPVRHLTGLRALHCFGSGGKGKLTTLEPLRGLPLTSLHCYRNKAIADLEPLRGMPLVELNVSETSVADLEPVRGMLLEGFDCRHTPVATLAPLEKARLSKLRCKNTPIFDHAILRSFPLRELTCGFSRWRDEADVRAITTLEKINQNTAKDFWQAVDDERAAFDIWVAETQKLPAEEQVQAVTKKFHELNPNTDDAAVSHEIRGGVVVGMQCVSDAIIDASAFRALKELKWLYLVPSSRYGKTKVADLWPLRGMALESLRLHQGELADLRPLQDMPLTLLRIGSNPVSDLSPLKGMQLSALYIEYTNVRDISALQDMPLTLLNARRARIADLTPLKGMKLTELVLMENDKVHDISALRGMPLVSLRLGTTLVTDLSPLAACPLESLDAPAQVTDLTPLLKMPLKSYSGPIVPWRDSRLLRSIKTLEVVNSKPAKEAFAWADWEDSVREMKPEDQLSAVAAKLQELNPGFDGKTLRFAVADGAVASITGRESDALVDISPFRALPRLKSLELSAPAAKGKMKLADLTPLRGLKLVPQS